jgi:uncharacterized protein (UPF0335 family)
MQRFNGQSPEHARIRELEQRVERLEHEKLSLASRIDDLEEERFSFENHSVYNYVDNDDD